MSTAAEDIATKFYQICPVQKGNPVISFHVDYRNGFVVTGLASGAVDAWPLPIELDGTISIDNVEEQKHEINTAAKGQDLNSANKKYCKYYCRRLIESDYETVRHVHVKHNNRIVSVVGDRYLREWQSYSAKHSTLKEYHFTRNIHSHTENCKFAQIVGHKNSMILYRKYGTKKLIYVNLDNLNQQRHITLLQPLTKDEFIMSFDGERFVTKKLNHDNGQKEISLFSIAAPHHHHHSNGTAAATDMLESKSNASTAVDGAAVARDLGLHWILNRSSKEYWGFQLNAEAPDRIVYVTNQNILKCYSIARKAVTQKLKGHSNFIVAFQHLKEYVVSIGTDKCVRIWDVKNKPDFKANCIYIRRKIPGHFVPGYLYKIVMHSNHVFYTSDDGIFAFQWK
mmetsp:Transcript_32027/g.51789  ORF Transcript_32027/g.51789 Transcript_32027/m.51789 type:complete len:396 (-) Transcript_32027:38-1225(-)